MNGFIKKAFVGLCLGGSLSTLVGCYTCDDLIDPCWPERYAYMSRQATHFVRDTQAAHGHKLDQTVWLYHFDSEVDPKTLESRPTAKLHPLGMQYLDYLARRRPHPDPKVYLQTSGDEKLDAQRQEAVLAYLNNRMTLIQPGFVFETPERVDPTGVGIMSAPIVPVINQYNAGFKGNR